MPPSSVIDWMYRNDRQEDQQLQKERPAAIHDLQDFFSGPMPEKDRENSQKPPPLAFLANKKPGVNPCSTQNPGFRRV